MQSTTSKLKVAFMTPEKRLGRTGLLSAFLAALPTSEHELHPWLIPVRVPRLFVVESSGSSDPVHLVYFDYPLLGLSQHLIWLESDLVGGVHHPPRGKLRMLVRALQSYERPRMLP